MQEGSNTNRAVVVPEIKCPLDDVVKTLVFLDGDSLCSLLCVVFLACLQKPWINQGRGSFLPCKIILILLWRTK